MATPSSSPPPPPPQEDPHQYPNPNHHDSSPSQSPSSNPSTSQNPLLQSTLSSSNKKPQPSLWSHQETVHLIESYQERWYALKRGPLRASQWEEIAVTVAARCDYDEPTKTAVQCRHKIEKLRKRYRAERGRPNARASWEFFDLMDRLERGPFPVSARPMALIQYRNSVPRGRGVLEVEEEEEDDEVRYNSGRRNRSESNKRKLGSGGIRVSGYLEKPAIRKHKERIESYESEEEEEGEGEEAVGGGVGELAAEIKAFTERFVRMEHKKMEVMRETERYRMEMESKRMEMILESQRKIVDTIGRAFGSHSKKFKMAQDG